MDPSESEQEEENLSEKERSDVVLSQSSQSYDSFIVHAAAGVYEANQAPATRTQEHATTAPEDIPHSDVFLFSASMFKTSHMFEWTFNISNSHKYWSCDNSAKSNVLEFNADLDILCIASVLLMAAIPLAMTKINKSILN